MLKRFRGYLAGTVFGLALGVVIVAASADVVSRLPSTRSPQDPATAVVDLIAALNGQITNYIAMGTGAEVGELQISGNENTWAPLGNVATDMSSVGPAGSHTTVQKWLVVFDTNGFKRFIPAF